MKFHLKGVLNEGVKRAKYYTMRFIEINLSMIYAYS